MVHGVASFEDLARLGGRRVKWKMLTSPACAPPFFFPAARGYLLLMTVMMSNPKGRFAIMYQGVPSSWVRHQRIRGRAQRNDDMAAVCSRHSCCEDLGVHGSKLADLGVPTHHRLRVPAGNADRPHVAPPAASSQFVCP